MKKIFTLLFASYMLVSLSGCDQVESIVKPGPGDVLVKYLNAKKDGNTNDSYQYISKQDKSITSFEEMIEKDKLPNDNPFAAVVLSDTKFKVVSVEKLENKASVKLEITAPDIRILAKETMREALKGGLFKISDPKKASLAVLERYKDKDLPIMTNFKTFNMVQEENGWKVFLDLKSKQEALVKSTKIYTLIDEADALKKSKKYQGAIKKYEEVLVLDSESVEAQNSIKEIKKEVATIKAKQEYMANVILYDFTAKYHDSYLDKNIPGVNFKIKNKGNRILKEVEVTVYFKNANGEIISEEDYHPVLVSSYSYGDNNKPLKPNYIWQMERSKFYQAKSVPSEWKEGSATAKITNIEFSEDVSNIESDVNVVASSDTEVGEKFETGDKQTYIEKIKLYDVRAKYYSTYRSDKVPGINFKLKNNGERTLKEVQVTAYFKDKDGTIIAEDEYHPVLVTSRSYGRDNTPLKPNYIWQMENNKFYTADNVPAEWKEGSVTAKITNIEFQD